MLAPRGRFPALSRLCRWRVGRAPLRVLGGTRGGPRDLRSALGGGVVLVFRDLLLTVLLRDHVFEKLAENDTVGVCD